MRSVLDRSSCCVVSTVRDRLGLSLVVCLSLTSSAPVPPPPFHPQLPKLFCLQLSFRERFCRLEVEGPCLMNIFLFTFMAGEWDDTGSRQAMQCLMKRRIFPGKLLKQWFCLKLWWWWWLFSTATKGLSLEFIFTQRRVLSSHSTPYQALIWIFEYSNIFVTLCFRHMGCRTFWGLWTWVSL